MAPQERLLAAFRPPVLQKLLFVLTLVGIGFARWLIASYTPLPSSLPSSSSLGRVAILVVVIGDVDGPNAVAVEQKTADYPVRSWASQINLLGGNYEHGDASPAATLQRELSEEGFHELAALASKLKPWRAWRVHAEAQVMPSKQPYDFDAVHFWIKVREQDARVWFGLGSEGKLRVMPLSQLSNQNKAAGTLTKERIEPASCFLWGYGELVQQTLLHLTQRESLSQPIWGSLDFCNCAGAIAMPVGNMEAVIQRWRQE